MDSLAAPLAAPELLAALRRGNGEAIAAVYREHAPALLRSIGAVLGDRSEAEDVVHDLFVGLPEAMARYEDRGVASPGWHADGAQQAPKPGAAAGGSPGCRV